MEGLFRKTLVDLIRGLRNNKGEEGAYVNERIQEIKEELKNPSATVKSLAIEKLTYLQMMGYDMNWAAFNVIEVMSSVKFSTKRIGYLAASQSFREEDTSVILLSTNLFKKDMTGQGGGALATHATLSQYEAGLALSCLANICTKDLARDLAADVLALLNSSKVYVRKKSILCLYKVFLKFPKALRPSFPRLKDKLEDSDHQVVSAAVNVICELARKNPKNYLGLAPIFFHILTSSNNNWMLIKIVKLFGALTPLEKRLGKKLIEPLTTMINTTSATSLLYECIQTCIIGLSEHQGLIRLCISKLRSFVEDPDQNLKYLGLLALHKIMQVHPKAVTEHRELVIKCLDSEDVSIRSRALDLLTGMVSKRNLMELIQKLMEKLENAEPEYADKLVEKIIAICAQDTYENVADFEWYLNVLFELTHVKSTQHGKLIANQLLDVTIRVKAIRSVSVANMVTLLKDPRVLTDNPSNGSVQEVLYSAAYIVGEYADMVDDHYQILEYLLHPRVLQFGQNIQSVFLLNALKILAFVAGQVDGGSEEDPDEEFDAELLDDMLDLMKETLVAFTTSTHIEVQERACFALELAETMLRHEEEGRTGLGLSISAIFDTTLNPVAAIAQRKVPVPDGLDLDAEINPVAVEEEEDFNSDFWARQAMAFDHDGSIAQPVITYASTGQSAASRAHNPWILSGTNSRLDIGGQETPDHKIEPLTGIGIDPSDGVSGYRIGDRLRGGRKKRRGEKATVDAIEEMPEGIQLSDEEKKPKQRARKAVDEEDDLSAVDLTVEMKPGEDILPVRQHRVVDAKTSATAAAAAAAAAAAGGDDKGEKRRRHHRGEKRSRDDRRRHRDKENKGGSGSVTSQVPPAGQSAAPVAEDRKSSVGNMLDTFFGPKDASSATLIQQPAYVTSPEKPQPTSGYNVLSGYNASGGGRVTPTSSSQSHSSHGRTTPSSSSSAHAPSPAPSPAPAAVTPADRARERRERRQQHRDTKGEREPRGRRQRSEADVGKGGTAPVAISGGAPAALLVSQSPPVAAPIAASSFAPSQAPVFVSSSSSAPAPAPAPSPSPAPAHAAAAQRPPLAAGHDDVLHVIYDIQTVPNQPQAILVLLGIRNTSPQALTAFQFQLGSSPNVKLVDQAPVSPQFVLQPGASCSTKAMFQIQSQTFPLGSQCSLSYTLAQGGRRQCPFQLRFPVSSFVVPIEVSLEAVSNLIASSEPKLSVSSCRVPQSFSSGDISRFIHHLVSEMRLFNVGGSRDSAALYGRCRLNGAHVCVYLHWSRQVIEVHSSDGRVGEAIVAEITQHN